MKKQSSPSPSRRYYYWYSSITVKLCIVVTSVYHTCNTATTATAFVARPIRKTFASTVSSKKQQAFNGRFSGAAAPSSSSSLPMSRFGSKDDPILRNDDVTSSSTGIPESSKMGERKRRKVGTRSREDTASATSRESSTTSRRAFMRNAFSIMAGATTLWTSSSSVMATSADVTTTTKTRIGSTRSNKMGIINDDHPLNAPLKNSTRVCNDAVRCNDGYGDDESSLSDSSSNDNDHRHRVGGGGRGRRIRRNGSAGLIDEEEHGNGNEQGRTGANGNRQKSTSVEKSSTKGTMNTGTASSTRDRDSNEKMGGKSNRNVTGSKGSGEVVKSSGESTTSTRAESSSGKTSGSRSSSGGGSTHSSGKSSTSRGGRGGGGGGHSSGCFPGDSLVDVRRQGEVLVRTMLLQDVEIGDEVRSGSDGSFSIVYAFGTRSTRNQIGNREMLRIHTESGSFLELTRNHILFLTGGDVTQPTHIRTGGGWFQFRTNGQRRTFAENVRIGDELIIIGNENDLEKERTSRVVAIESIAKNEGIYHPLTYDGRIVVNGILASVHATDGVAPSIHLSPNMSGMKLPLHSHHVLHVDVHSFQQLIFSPLRVLCTISFEQFCSAPHQLDAEDGSHHYVNIIEAVQRFLFSQAAHNIGMNGHEHEQGEVEVNILEWSLAQLPLRLCFLIWIVSSSLVEQTLFHPLWFVAIMSITMWSFIGVYRRKQKVNEKP